MKFVINLETKNFEIFESVAWSIYNCQLANWIKFKKKKILILELGWLGSDFGVAGTILPDQFLHVIRKDATERDVASLYNWILFLCQYIYK